MTSTTCHEPGRQCPGCHAPRRETEYKTTNVILDEIYCRERIEVQPGPYVLLAVSDTGIGMDAETLSHMRDPYQNFAYALIKKRRFQLTLSSCTFRID